jgi:glyoxylase-like metal-dependent hydrolase (beta-lactamase superfamily II)
MIFRQLFDAESSTFTYLIGCERTRAAAIVDPVREQIDRDLALVRELGLALTNTVETHVHADHVTAAGEIRRRTGARTLVSRADGPACADEGLAEGDVVSVGDVTLRTLATPGHTAGCLSFVVGQGGTSEDRVLTGDALLVRGCGRTDFQGGDSGKLWGSVTSKLFALGDAMLVFPAHDYRGLNMTTIGEERRWNPRLGGEATRETFVALMAALHLPPPKKIDEAVPANRACGDDGAADPRRPGPPVQG